jgi:hypothetical protein
MITLYMLQGGNRPRPPHRPISLGSSQSSGHGCSRCIAARRCSERCRGGVYRLWAPPVPDRPSRLRFSRPFSCRCIACDSGARIQTPFDCNCSFRGVRTLRTWPAIFRTKGRPRGCCASSGRRCSGTQHHGGSAEFHGAWVDGSHGEDGVRGGRLCTSKWPAGLLTATMPGTCPAHPKIHTSDYLSLFTAPHNECSRSTIIREETSSAFTNNPNNSSVCMSAVAQLVMFSSRSHRPAVSC